MKTRELIREFTIEGQQCTQGVISPNGKALAFKAQKVGAYNGFVVVIDVETGRELARKKSPTIYQLTFLPDSRTLAIGFSGFTTGEPINLWTW